MGGNTYVLVLCAMGGVFFIVFSMIILHVKMQNRILVQKKTIAENEIFHQKTLSKKMIASQEEERKRIGRDLHDEVGTSLSALRMLLEKIKDAEEVEYISRLANTGKDSIDRIINNVRKISHNLSPFTKGVYELIPALEDISEQVNQTEAPQVFLNLNDIQDFSYLGVDVQLALYRILSELINNTIKHASASRILIDFVWSEDVLTVNYSDDGIGIANPKISRGIGMSNIESRCNFMNATYKIDDGEIKGFYMQLKIPLMV